MPEKANSVKMEPAKTYEKQPTKDTIATMDTT